MDINKVVVAINKYQEKTGGQQGFDEDMAQYDELVDDGENEICFDSKAFSNQTTRWTFSVETARGKIISVHGKEEEDYRE
jgi:hypothetical protein